MDTDSCSQLLFTFDTDNEYMVNVTIPVEDEETLEQFQKSINVRMLSIDGKLLCFIDDNMFPLKKQHIKVYRLKDKKKKSSPSLVCKDTESTNQDLISNLDKSLIIGQDDYEEITILPEEFEKTPGLNGTFNCISMPLCL